MITTPRTLRLSVGQEAMWIAWKLDPAQWIHIIPTPFLVRGTIEMARLERAVSALGRVYPQLRGRVVPGTDGPMLDWSDAPAIPVRESVTDLGLDDAVRRTWQVPFDLRRGPLARVDLVRGPDYTVLVIAVHHLVYDGASILILLDALARAYAGEPLPEVDHVPALEAFADRSWQLASARTGELHRAYWRLALGSGAPRFALPATVDPPQYTVLSDAVPADLAARLRARAAELDVSYVTVLFGAYYALLRRYSGACDILAFVPFHGRTARDLEDTIGYFVNALPIRCEVRASDTYAALLRRVRSQVKEAMRHGDLPLPAIMRAAGLTGPEAHASTHQTVFQFWHAGLRDGIDVQNLLLRGGDSTAALSLLDMESSAGFALAVMVREDSAGTHVLWKDPAGAVGPTTVAAMAADYGEVLRSIADNPDAEVIGVVTRSGVRSGARTPSVEVPGPRAADPGKVARMIAVWQDVLELEEIGPDDSFFELGGHSLLAESLVLEVSERFGREVPIRTLFEFPRVSEFAAEVLGAEPAGADTAAFPASSVQRRIWLAEQVEGGRAAYNVPLAWRVAGRLDRAALRQALATMIARHEILRTEFHDRDGELWQVVVDPWMPDVAGVDLRDRPDPERALREWLRAASHHAFEPARGRLLTAALVEVGESDQVLFVCMHHLVCDGESTAAFLDELSSCYAAAIAGAARRTPDAIAVHDQQSLAFSLPASPGIAASAERLGVGVPDVLLAGFAALLGWYTGEEEIVVGVSHPRGSAGDGAVGPRPVPLRPAAHESFAALVAQAARGAAGSTSAAPVDALFSWIDDDPIEAASGPGRRGVHLILRPASGGHEGRLIFDGSLVDHDQMEAMAEHYRTLLAQLAAAPERAIGEADPLTESERHTQLAVWNGTEAAYPQTPVHELIQQRALARPQAIALTDGEAELTYRELLDRAGAMARGLLSRGVRGGELVALLLPRGAEQVRAILAVLLSGGAYLPIDPALPAERVEFMLADSGARWIVVPESPDLHPGLHGFPGQVVRTGELARAAASDPLPRVPLDSPAYCIYTSGTTGRPKGVVITHRNLVRLLHCDRAPFSFGPADVWTLFHSYAFDFSVWELFGGLSHGGRVVIVSEEEARDPWLFWQLLQRQRVTVLNQTPGAFRRLLSLEPQSPAALNRLRYVIFGGEALRPAMLRSWSERYPHVRLVNMYGITENTVHASFRVVTRPDIDSDASIIGTPIPTTTLFLVDRHTGRRLLPVGAVGEIFIGGAGVAGGYLGRPELTAERFVKSPFGPGTLFRSGDLARYRPDGALEFIGRADSQVKVRGYRVELGEVEARLRQHPAVVDAVAVAEDDRLIAILQARAPLTSADLRRYLAERLPDYMIPSAFQVVDRLALTANGKLDVAALRAASASLDTAEVKAPRTSTATAIASMWCRLLGVAAVGANDSFFALGGHSMLAVRLLGEIRERFGVGLAVKTLFEHPRLQELADRIDSELGGRTVALAHPRPHAGGEIEATAFQQRLWLAEQIDERVRNNVVLAWKTDGRLDVERLGRSFARLVADHEILRTSFVMAGGTLRQVVNRPWEPAIELLDLSRAADPDVELTRWLDEAAQRPFDVASGRLLRVALAELGADRHALLLCLHHLLIDGDSVAILLGELARRQGDEGERAAPPAQYRDLAAAQEAARDSAQRRADLAFWQASLAGAPAHVDFPAPARPGPDGAVDLPLPADLVDRLRPLQTEHGVTWFMAFATALAIALHRWTGRSSLTFGVPMSTREQGPFAAVLGPCLNTVVLRSELTDGASLLDVLRAMRSQMMDAFEHARAPFEEVLKRLEPERAPGRTPYIDVTLNMNRRSNRRAELDGVRLEPWFAGSLWTHEAKFGLTVTAIEQDGGLTAVLSYRGDRVSEADARQLAGSIGELLAQLAELGGAPSSQLHATAGAAAARVQYRDFVTAQEAARSSQQQRADLAFWRDRLAGASPYLDFPAPERAGPNGAVPIPLPADLIERLRPLQAEHDVTSFMLAATALAVSLHRSTGARDLVIATPMANRDDPRFARLLGPCLDAVVLRSELAGGATTLDVLRSMRAEVLGAFEHAGAPFEEIVDRLNPPRRPGRTPYADVSLTFGAATAAPALAGHPLHAISIDGEDADFVGKLGITVALALDGARLTGRIAYRGDRHRRDDVERLASLFGRTLELLPDDLASQVSTVESERDAQLRRWERGPDPEDMTPVPALVLEQALAGPDRPALASGSTTLSYPGLVRRARALARRIRPHLGGAEPVVALLVERGEEFAVAMLASWLAGAAFCPIDPSWPSARVDFILDDTGASVLLTDREPPATRSTPIVRVNQVGLDPVDLAGGPDGPDHGASWTPDAAAYVIYTSGSTGEPKGVVVTHRGLAQVIQWSVRTYGFGPGDRCSHLLSVGFDAAQGEVWSALASGACLVPHVAAVTPSTLCDWLHREQITICSLATPLAEVVWSTGHVPGQLRWMFIGGAALSDSPPANLPYRVSNQYGPTENSIVATAQELPAGSEPPLNRIGTPIAGVRVHVLDADGHRCPVGTAGEICLAGGGLAREYLRRPELTSTKFPTVVLDGQPVRIYRTGDLGRWLEDGTLEYIGRADRQIKLRGHRIELGEIEQLLLRQPEVGRSVVCAYPDRAPALVAYVTASGRGRIESMELLLRLRSSLPPFMVPEAVVWLDELPFGTNGKIDESRLPFPNRADLVGAEALAPAATDLERRIAAIWSELLSTPRVGMHDNFFDLGGNSLMLAKLHRRLITELERDIPLTALFEHPTVAALASALRGAGARSGSSREAGSDADVGS